MKALDKAFIKAYGLQEASTRKLMPLSAALELSHDAGDNSSAEEEINVESHVEEAETVNVAVQQKAVQDYFPSEPAVSRSESSTQTASEFMPLLQVNAFAWPHTCDRLDGAADEQLHVLADCVDMQAEKGRKIIGFVGDKSGSGCTTLLLSVARRLARRCRVAIVDANRDNPGISRDLGLLPDVGLKDVAAGHMAIDEALIESLDDSLTLLPYAGHTEAEYNVDADVFSRNLRELNGHYDLILVDLGTLKGARKVSSQTPDACCTKKAPDTFSSPFSSLDAAVIVRDARGRRSSGALHAMEMLRAA